MKKTSFDIRSMILCAIISVAFLIPLFVCAVATRLATVYIVFVIVSIFAIIGLLIIYVATRKSILFKKDGIVLIEDSVKFLYHEIRIEYYDGSFWPILAPFSIVIHYNNPTNSQHEELYVPCAKKTFLKIRGLIRD